ncbi:MAG: alpha/beta hydrolase [Sphingomonadales bacterium]|nr:alpha/beta hydrolase [Sphingomonadales bacterium]
MSNTSTWADSSWTSDGLRLHYRDYAGPKNRPALLCMPGLTRNIRDFEPLIAHLAGDWRIIAVEFRGRGESEYSKAPASYAPPVYAQDVALLIEELKLRKIVTIGTSLGGLVSMMLAAMLPDRIVGAVLNDIGPVVEQRGLDRIKSYVGKAQAWPTWVHAARAAAEQNADVYPGYDLENWIAMAKRLNTLTPQGRVVPDYDPRIAEPIRAEQTNAVPPDLWPLYEAFGEAQVLVLRGELSDILSAETARAMGRRLPNAKVRTVPDVGHAPVLDEPASVRAIQGLLKAVMA